MRVLVVEDHQRLAATVANVLRCEGMAVDVSHDGSDAIFRTDVVTYDVVVLDRDIPGVHGDDVCRKLVAAGRPTGVLMLTAASTIEDRVEGLGIGADDYLTKPFHLDELKHLGDTIDELLARLETAFDAQRRFVANASHELRTPLTAARALLEMVLSDPDATTETFREICTQVLDEGEQQEQLIAALLALAQGQRGLDRRQSLDLAVVAHAEIDRHELEALSRDVRIEAELSPAGLSGDRRMIAMLVCNLLENSLRHNVPGGLIKLRVHQRAGRTSLTLENTGDEIAPAQLRRLTQPFQRLAPDRTTPRRARTRVVDRRGDRHRPRRDARAGAT